MKLAATVKNTFHHHEAVVQTNDDSKVVEIPAKSSGYGSSVNGGELLLLALATCFCNDIYREAAKREISVSEVEVVCTGEFGAEGEPGTNFHYKANVVANAPAEEIDALIRHTDKVAEIQNTLRKGLNITLSD
ncbi:OsmC family protein [Spirosoma sp. KCTC 42546]|uniref:OsmC family protein n=1 Tax=Spirosoma sp. KCTC 42546 TaxID=2520506 RepID=UPI00115BA0E4|nr:OsmC family protein [Spirosoma sp. KCTC 42546]QDK81521.1 OsmC family protein [Spirosoma sp. KCTC 42546]